MYARVCLLIKAQPVVLASNFDEGFRRKLLDWVYPFCSANNHSSHRRSNLALTQVNA